MKARFLKTLLSLPLLLVTTSSFATTPTTPLTQTQGLMAPTGTFTPFVSFTETRIDRYSVAKDPVSGDISRSIATTRHERFVIDASLVGVTTSGFTADTGVGCQIGYFYHNDFLGDDPKYTTGKTSATFPLYDGVNFDKNGDPVAVGTITYSWTNSRLIITMSGVNVGSIAENEIFPSIETGPSGRWPYRNRAPVYVYVDGNEGSANLFDNGVVSRSTASCGGTSQGLTNFVMTSARVVTPPVVASASYITIPPNSLNPFHGAGISVLSITEQFPEYFSYPTVTLNGAPFMLPSSYLDTSDNLTNTNDTPSLDNESQFLWPIANYGQQTATIMLVLANNAVTGYAFNQGDEFVISWTDEFGKSIQSTYKVP